MIILHNSMAGESHDFVDALLSRTVDASEFSGGVLTEGGHTIYGWYEEGRKAWWAISGTDKVSAFPSVVVDVPEYDQEIIDIDGEVVDVITHPAQQVALRQVLDVAEVSAFLAEQNKHLAKSKKSGMTPSPAKLTLANLNQADTGRG